jgi:hypothetical protein
LSEPPNRRNAARRAFQSLSNGDQACQYGGRRHRFFALTQSLPSLSDYREGRQSANAVLRILRDGKADEQEAR